MPREDELERDEKLSSGRVILVAIDHGPISQAAFTWALDQFVTHADTIDLLHVLPSCVFPPFFFAFKNRKKSIKWTVVILRQLFSSFALHSFHRGPNPEN